MKRESITPKDKRARKAHFGPTGIAGPAKYCSSRAEGRSRNLDRPQTDTGQNCVRYSPSSGANSRADWDRASVAGGSSDVPRMEVAFTRHAVPFAFFAAPAET